MISTKGRYAIRVMIDLAENGREQAIPLKDIAERQGVSKKYLEILVENAKIATRNHTVICQDTGVPTFFLRTSLAFPTAAACGRPLTRRCTS